MTATTQYPSKSCSCERCISTSTDGRQITGQKIARFGRNKASSAIHQPKRRGRPRLRRRFCQCAVKTRLQIYIHFPRNVLAEHLEVRGCEWKRRCRID